jgi:pimeloyl-ACP methyl ester carboxylesterase
MPEPAFTIPEPLRPYVRRVPVGDIELHCYDAGAGDAPPLLLIHGLGDEADTWRHVLLPLAARRRVIALDLPGFGRSDRPRRAYTLAFFAQTVARLLGALGIERATLVGSSMGAATAQRLALAHPELVERLVLIGGCVPAARSLPPAAMWLFLTPGLGEAIYTSLRRSADGGYATLEPYYHSLANLSDEDRAFLAERVRARVESDGQRRAFLSALRWLSVERALRAEQLRALVVHQATPTLLVWGENDSIVPVAAAHAMAALLPSAQVELIGACGHLPQQERPSELIALIERSAHDA